MRMFSTPYDLHKIHIELKQRNNILHLLSCWWFFHSLWMSLMLLPPPPPPPITIVWRLLLTEVQWEVINSLSPLQRSLSVAGRLMRGKKESALNSYFCWDTQREPRRRREINSCFTGWNSLIGRWWWIKELSNKWTATTYWGQLWPGFKSRRRRLFFVILLLAPGGFPP